MANAHPPSNTGFISPGTVVNAADGPGAANDPWTNPGNAATDDGNHAVWADVITSLESSQVLKCTNFDLSSIPDNAWIDGISLRLDCVRTGTATAAWYYMFTGYDDSGVYNNWGIQADNANFGTDVIFPPVSGAILGEYFSQISDLISWTNGQFQTWIGSDLNSNSLFGTGIVAQSQDATAGGNIEIDHVEMRVHYHEGFPAKVCAGIVRNAEDCPPFLYNGRVYVIRTYYVSTQPNNTNLGVFKSGPNPAVGKWTSLDSGDAPDLADDTTDTDATTYFIDGTTLHIAWKNGATISYTTFNLSTEQWSATGVQTVTTQTNQDYAETLQMVVRANGDVVLAYDGARDKVMGGDKGRVDYALYNGSIWNSDQALDASGDVHYAAPGTIETGTTNYVAAYWMRQTSTAFDPAQTWEDWQSRTLTGGTSWNTVTTTTTAMTGCVQRSHGYLKNLKLAYWDDTNDGVRVQQATINSGVLNWSSGEFSNNAFSGDVPTNALGAGHAYSLAYDEDNGDYYFLFVGGTGGIERDIFYSRSTDGMSTWETPVLIEGAQTGDRSEWYTIYSINGAVFTRNGRKVLAVMYDIASSSLRYNEIVLEEPFLPYHAKVNDARKRNTLLRM